MLFKFMYFSLGLRGSPFVFCLNSYLNDFKVDDEGDGEFFTYCIHP